MSAATLHNINYHQNSTVTCIAKIFIHNSLLVCTKSLQYMIIVMVLTIVICHDSRIVMSQNVTIAHLYILYVHIFMYTYVYASYVCAYVRMCVCMCMYVRTYVCMYICMYPKMFL